MNAERKEFYLNPRTLDTGDIVVSDRVARLAKKKGFNIPTIWYNHPDYGLSANSFNEREELNSMNRSEWADGYYSIPTQTAIRTWLMDNFNIFIEMKLVATIGSKEHPFYSPCIKELRENVKHDPMSEISGLEFKLALDFALLKALKRID